MFRFTRLTLVGLCLLLAGCGSRNDAQVSGSATTSKRKALLVLCATARCEELVEIAAPWARVQRVNLSEDPTSELAVLLSEVPRDDQGWSSRPNIEYRPVDPLGILTIQELADVAVKLDDILQTGGSGAQWAVSFLARFENLRMRGRAVETRCAFVQAGMGLDLFQVSKNSFPGRDSFLFPDVCDAPTKLLQLVPAAEVDWNVADLFIAFDDDPEIELIRKLAPASSLVVVPSVDNPATQSPSRYVEIFDTLDTAIRRRGVSKRAAPTSKVNPHVASPAVTPEEFRVLAPRVRAVFPAILSTQSDQPIRWSAEVVAGSRPSAGEGDRVAMRLSYNYEVDTASGYFRGFIAGEISGQAVCREYLVDGSDHFARARNRLNDSTSLQYQPVEKSDYLALENVAGSLIRSREMIGALIGAQIPVEEGRYGFAVEGEIVRNLLAPVDDLPFGESFSETTIEVQIGSDAELAGYAFAFKPGGAGSVLPSGVVTVRTRPLTLKPGLESPFPVCLKP
jgi:hypothetical protein